MPKMKRLDRTRYIIATLPALVPLTLWISAWSVHVLVCPAWCLTCSGHCTAGAIDASPLVSAGLVYGPLLLAVAAPVSIVLLSVLVVLDRR